MRKILTASAAIAVLGASSALANETLDAILASDFFAGATINETRVNLFGIKVEATLPDGTEVENRYRADGSLRKSEVVVDGVKTETTFDKAGNVVKTETELEDDDHHGSNSGRGSRDDDDDDDDHHSSGHDDDDDGDHSGSSGHDSGDDDSGHGGDDNSGSGSDSSGSGGGDDD